MINPKNARKYSIEIDPEPDDDWQVPLWKPYKRMTAQKAYQTSQNQANNNIFLVLKGVLYRWSINGVSVRCTIGEEVQHVMNKVYTGTCGTRQNGQEI